jgi:hypothetical protein
MRCIYHLSRSTNYCKLICLSLFLLIRENISNVSSSDTTKFSFLSNSENSPCSIELSWFMSASIRTVSGLIVLHFRYDIKVLMLRRPRYYWMILCLPEGNLSCRKPINYSLEMRPERSVSKLRKSSKTSLLV